MYLAHITLFAVLCVISEQSSLYKCCQFITDITVHTIPGTTTDVYFNTNSISLVPANYFKNLLSLDKIYLYLNDITDIDDTAFSQVPSVKVIDLSINKLSVIREMMFSGLPNLWAIYLYKNQIHTIETASFKDNIALITLSLASNSLETVSQSIFDPNNHPTNLKHFKIYGNPLQCNSSLSWLKQVDTTWITVKQPYDTECEGPTALAGCKWDSLTDQDLCTIFNTSG